MQSQYNSNNILGGEKEEGVKDKVFKLYMEE